MFEWLNRAIWRLAHPTEAAKLDVLTFAYGEGTAIQIAQEKEGINLPPTVGEMTNTVFGGIGRTISSVASWTKWILILIAAILGLWLVLKVVK